MALTAGFKFTCVIVIAGAMVGGYVYWKGHHVPAPTPVDTGVPEVSQQAPQQPEPVQPQAVQPDPAVAQAATGNYAPQEQQPQQQDASSNRGMQFLLNQGKKQ